MHQHFSAQLASLTIAVCLFSRAAAFASPLAYIANADGNSVSVIDTDDNTIIKTIGNLSHPVAISINPSGTRVYVTNIGGSQATVASINTQTNAVTHIFVPAMFATYLSSVAVNPTQDRVYALVYFDKIQILNSITNTVIGSITVSVGAGNLVAMALNPAGTKGYVTTTDGTVSVVDTTTNLETTTIPSAGEYAIAHHPSASFAYSALPSIPFGLRDTVTVIDTSTDTVSTTIDVSATCGGVSGLALNPAGTRLYAGCLNTGKVVVIDTTNNTVVTSITVGFAPDGVSLTPDGSRVYVASYGDNTVSVIDTATNAVVDTIAVGDEPHNAFGPFIGPDFVCGNGTIEPGEGCDDGNLVSNDGCNSTCRTEQDWVVLPLKPLTIKIPEGTSSVTKSVKVKVHNANVGTQTTPPLTTVSVIPNASCFNFYYNYLNFGSGETSLATVPPGETVTGLLTITASFSQFTTFNRKAPNRCTFTLTAYPTKDFVDERNASNDVALLEVHVIDQNDPEMEFLHETTIGSMKPLKVKIAADNASATKTVKLKVGNADDLSMAEAASAHNVTVSALDGTCPAMTVGAVTFDGAPSADIEGGKTAKAVLPLTLNASGLTSPAKDSPARCIVSLTASGPAGDIETSNNSTQLVIDVVDKNDLP